jgi:integrase/recombinase XerD
MIRSSKCRPRNGAGRCLVELSPYEIGSRCLQQDQRAEIRHLRVSGRGEKTRYVPLHGIARDLIEDHLKQSGHTGDREGPLFLRVFRVRKGPAGRGSLTARTPARSITPDGVYKLVPYRSAVEFEIGVHALRATAATNPLDHQADIAKVQEWLGHSKFATTRLYDHRTTRPEDSPTV